MRCTHTHTDALISTLRKKRTKNQIILQTYTQILNILRTEARSRKESCAQTHRAIARMNERSKTKQPHRIKWKTKKKQATLQRSNSDSNTHSNNRSTSSNRLCSEWNRVETIDIRVKHMIFFSGVIASIFVRSNSGRYCDFDKWIFTLIYLIVAHKPTQDYE